MAELTVKRPTAGGASMLDELDEMRELTKIVRKHVDLLRRGVVVERVLADLEDQLEVCEQMMPATGYSRRGC